MVNARHAKRLDWFYRRQQHRGASLVKKVSERAATLVGGKRRIFNFFESAPKKAFPSL